jgi:hypothetical protein
MTTIKNACACRDRPFFEAEEAEIGEAERVFSRAS